MSEYSKLSSQELLKIQEKLKEKYNSYKERKLNLDMSRGKPESKQLDLSEGLLTCISTIDECKVGGCPDCRNYGFVDGIPEAKKLFSEMMEVSEKEIIIGGNSSLNLMYDTISRAMTHGVLGSTPWAKLDKIKFLCPCPGYDRHFAVTEHFGFELIPIEMLSDGPDMKEVKRLVESDADIKGIWCNPKYSNPQGITYSDRVVDEFANLNPKAEDFRIFWDNAYTVHHLYPEHDHLKNILTALKITGKENMVYIFGSTSKISFPGAGVAVIAASEENINSIKKQMAFQTIGPDKINQLRHIKFFKNLDGINAQMKKHAAIIRPKFQTVIDTFHKEFDGTGIAEWTNPKGGYFISFDTLDGCAKRTVELCKAAGVKTTPAGASFPYGIDPRDRNIRVAPTFPPIDELKTAVNLFCVCVKLASIEKLLSSK